MLGKNVLIRGGAGFVGHNGGDVRDPDAVKHAISHTDAAVSSQGPVG